MQIGNEYISVKSLLQLIAVALSINATLFLYLTSIGLPAKDIRRLAKPKWDYHPEIAENLMKEKVTARIGAAYLLLAATLQIIQLSLATNLGDFGPIGMVECGIAFFAFALSLEIGGIF